METQRRKRYVSPTELCVAPVNEGVVDVAVTVNGVEFGASSSTFTSPSDATYELRPRPLSKGGTIVQVRGPHLELAPSLACRFGVHEVPASVKGGPRLQPPLRLGPWPSAWWATVGWSTLLNCVLFQLGTATLGSHAARARRC